MKRSGESSKDPHYTSFLGVGLGIGGNVLLTAVLCGGSLKLVFSAVSERA